MSCQDLSECRNFLEEITSTSDEDIWYIKVGAYRIEDFEILGEVINWTLRFLAERKCPASLTAPITRNVVEIVQSECRKSPAACGLNAATGKYEPSALKQMVVASLKNFCQRLLDNVELNKILPTQAEQVDFSKYVVGSVRNRRRSMEDWHICIEDFNATFNIQRVQKARFYAVFDGHHGHNAAMYSAAQLPFLLATDPAYPDRPCEALKNAFLATDNAFLDKCEQQSIHGGTTAVCALHFPQQNVLYIAWVGDSKALLVKQGQFMQIVKPHKASCPIESARIKSQGGMIMSWEGTVRVNGILDLSRAIGDRNCKPYVSSDPDITCIELDNQEDFLVLGCDGLWDYVKDEDVAHTVYKQLEADCENLNAIPQSLIEISKLQGSTDNITVIIVFLKQPCLIVKNSRSLEAMETTFDNCNNTDLNNPVQNLLQNANTEFTSEKKTHEIFKADNPFNDGLNNFMQISDTNNKMNINLNCDEELEHRDLPKSEQLFNFGDDEFEQKINEKRHFDGDLGPETSVDVPDEIMATESSEENLSKSSLSHSKDVLPLSENLNPFDPKNSFTDFDTNEFHVQDDTKTCTSLSENLLDTPVDQASLDDAKNMLPADCIHTNGIHTEDSTPEDVMGQDHLPSFDDHGMGVSDDGKDHFIDNEFEDNRDKDTIEAFDQHFGEQHEFREEQENNIKSEEFSLEDAKKFDDFCVEKDQKDIEENNIRNESQDLFENKNVFELNPPGLQNQPEYLEYESGTEENENDSPNVGPPLEDNNFNDYNAIVEDQKEEQEIHLQDQVPDVDLVGEKDIEDSLAFKENEIDHSDTQFGCLDETIEMNSEIQPISQDMLFSSEVIDRKEHPEQETELNSLATVEENIEVQLGVEEVEEAVEEPEIIKEVQQLESNIVDSNVQEASCFDNMEMDIKPETPSQDPARESTAAESCEESEDEWNYMRLKGEGQKEVSKIPEIEEQPTSPVVLENDKVIVENSEFIDQKFEETESKEAIITSVEESSKESLPSVEHSTDNLEISETLLDNSDNEPEDMSSQLNPEAKEFIPINASPVHFELSNGIPPNKAALITKDDVVAQSPRKGLISMDDIQVPSEVEFGNEIAHCPSEMQYSPDFVHNDLYQEMNLKEAMHGSEKEEPAVEENFPYDGPKNLDNVGMKESIYIEQTENLMNTVQPIPTNLDDFDDFLQNDSIVANASITETMEKLNLSAEIEFDSFAQSTFNEITESLKQMGKVEPTEAQTIELLSNVEQEFPVEKVIPSSEVTAPSSEVITPSPEVIAPSPEVVTPSPEVVSPSPEVIAPTPEVRMEFDPVQAAVVPELKTVTEVLEPLAVKSNELIEVTASPVVEQLPAEPSPKVESTIEQKDEEKKITEKTVSKVEATKSATKVLDAKKDIKPKTTTSTTSKRVGSNTSTLSSDTTKLRASQGTAAKPKTTPTASRPRTVPSATKPLAEKKTSTSSTSVAAARPKVDSKTSLSAATRKPAASTGSRPTKPDEQPKVGVKQSASKTGVAAKPSVSATRTLSGTTPATKTRPATATANTTATKPASQRVPLSVPAKSASTSKTAAMSPRSTLTSTMRKTEAIKSPVGTKKLSATKTTTTTQTSLATKSKPSTPNTKTPTTPNSTLNAKKLPLTPSPRPIQKRTPIKKPTTTAVKKVSDENNKTQDTTIDIKLNGTAIIETVNNKTELIE